MWLPRVVSGSSNSEVRITAPTGWVLDARLVDREHPEARSGKVVRAAARRVRVVCVVFYKVSARASVSLITYGSALPAKTWLAVFSPSDVTTWFSTEHC